MNARRPVPAGQPFRGFPPQALAFLTGLRANNDTAWFEAHRADYDRFVLGPMRALAAEFGEWFEAEVDAGLDTRPVVGGAIGRLRRDTRFSSDKRPYKQSVWLVFRNRDAAMGNLGFYWDLSPSGYCYGMGFYSALPRVLRSIRERALDNPDRFRAAVAGLDTDPPFNIEGEPYRRSSMPGAPPDLARWLDRKNLYVEAGRPHDSTLAGRDLVALLWDAWERLVPLYWFLRG
jgi:uncharacterized protein (TIGR02453 family)